VAAETESDKPKTVRVENVNLQAMAAIDKILGKLPAKSRKAVIAWVNSEYGEDEHAG
jgi:hypothetical protein